MKLPRLSAAPLLLCILLPGCHAAQPAAHSSHAPPLTIADLNSRSVTGNLGLPLGTVAGIRATIARGEGKADSDRYFLRVSTVNGQQLTHPLQMAFHLAPGADAHLAADQSELYILKTGAIPDSIGSAQLSNLEKEYVGSSVHLVVYETGAFAGIPNDLPYEWQDHAFNFGTWLQVLQEINDK